MAQAAPAVQQAAQQLPQPTPQANTNPLVNQMPTPQSLTSIAPPAQGGKGGQPPTPQQLSRGLQQQDMMQDYYRKRTNKGGQPLPPEMMQQAQEGMSNIIRSRAMRNRGQY